MWTKGSLPARWQPPAVDEAVERHEGEEEQGAKMRREGGLRVSTNWTGRWRITLKSDAQTDRRHRPNETRRPVIIKSFRSSYALLHGVMTRGQHDTVDVVVPEPPLRVGNFDFVARHLTRSHAPVARKDPVLDAVAPEPLGILLL